MNKQEYYESLSKAEYPAVIELDGVRFDDNHRHLKARHYEYGLQKGEELAKEFAEWAEKRGYYFVKGRYQTFSQISDRSYDSIKSYDELFNDFIQSKTTQNV